MEDNPLAFKTCRYCRSDIRDNDDLTVFISAEEITGKKCPENSPNWEQRIVDVITMDKFCEERNVFPDFIKMDIEGSELSALKGGMSTIKKCRPQLAISIYHSSEDFINIPLYLKENLENYTFRLGHYSPRLSETVLYAIPKELA